MAEQSLMRYARSTSTFHKFSWGLLAYNLLVIMWGVYVRVSGSGAGCGGHWPTCNGEIVPVSPQFTTIVEFSHRLTSGFALILAAGIFLWALRLYPKGHAARVFSAAILLFTLTEAIIGAGLVLFGLVANNSSIARAVSIAAHLVNTLLLIGAITLTAWVTSEDESSYMTVRKPAPSDHRYSLLLGVSLAGMLVVSAAGTVTALGDTLFPASTLAQGLAQDVSPLSNFLLRLRVIHPILAVSLALFTAGLVIRIRSKTNFQLIRKLSNVLLGLFSLQILLGLLNVVLLAPNWMQFIHLLVADLVWIVLIIYTTFFSSYKGFA